MAHKPDDEGQGGRPVPMTRAPRRVYETVAERLKREHEDRCRKARKLLVNRRK